MMRVLLTGGSTFVSAHVLDILLARGHSVVAMVNSQANALGIKSIYPYVSKDKLDFTFVKNIAAPDAFYEAVISNPPFEAVIHPASARQIRRTKSDMSDRGLIGSTRLLEAIKENAPTVERVVITSSIGAIIDPHKIADKKYSEADWNPVAEAEVSQKPINDSRASRVTFAERAAWDFVEKEKLNFTLTSVSIFNTLVQLLFCILPLLFGPQIGLNSLNYLDGTNQRIYRFMKGDAKKVCPPAGSYFFADVRDVALSHVLAAEKKEAAGKRFLIVADKFCNRQILEIIGEKFPQLRGKLPTGKELEEDDFSAARMPSFDNRRSVEVLGMTYRSLAESIVDVVKAWGHLQFSNGGRLKKVIPMPLELVSGAR